MKDTLILMAALLGLSLWGCKSETMEKFNWSHTLSAPKGYPMEVYHALLKGQKESDYSASFGLWGVANEGWGRPSGMVTAGPDLKAVPDSLHITYFSYTEDKFYTGRFELPRERMIRLFQDGFYDYDMQRSQTFTQIVVGMAPGGVVVVWLLGEQVEKEVARFLATETSVDLEAVHPNQYHLFEEKYIEHVLSTKATKASEIPFGLWDAYRIKYSWRPEIVYPEGFRHSVEWLSFFNGEKEHNFSEDPTYGSYKKRAIPDYLSFAWYDAEGNKFGVRNWFDEEEIFKAFVEMHQEDKEQNIDLVFQLNEERNKFLVCLRNSSKMHEIKNIRQEIYTKAE